MNSLLELDYLEIILVGIGTYFLYTCCKICYFINYKSYLYMKHPKRLVYRVICDYRGFVNGVMSLLNRKPLAYRIVGMDCEMTSDSVKGGHPVPAVLQLANPDGFCAIFQLKVIETMEREHNTIFRDDRFPISLPSSMNMLSEVLENPAILKVGVAVINDAQYLEESYGLVSKGCLDIRHVAEQLSVEPRGLGHLARVVLGKEKCEIKKGSPWESRRLPKNQIEYAALDARLGVDIFMKLNDQEICRRYSWIKRLFWDEKTYWSHSMELWEKFIGKPFHFWPENTIRYSLKMHLPSKTYYGLFRYFTPESARHCVVCLNDNQLIRKAVVPADYNIVFDDDLLPYLELCIRCFSRSRQQDYIFREEICEESGAPYPDYKDKRLETLKNIARDILKNGQNTEQLELKEYYVCKTLGLPKYYLHPETMETILSMDCWPGSAHGQFVHDYFERFYPDGTDRLKKMWCQRFITTMTPRYLPQPWIKYSRRLHFVWF